MRCYTRASPMALQAARLRLRERFQSKFPVVTAAAVDRPPQLAHSNSSMVVVPAQKNLQHLDAARVRLSDRFHKNFSAVSIITPSSTIGNGMSFVPQKEPNKLLEDARLRLRQRFHSRFGPPDFDSFPTSVEDAWSAMKNDDEWGSNNAMVVTRASHPFTIVRVNACWEDLCGFTQDEARGETFGSLKIQGSFTENVALKTLSNKLKKKEQVAVHLTNQSRDGQRFDNYLRVAPLTDKESGDVTHFIGVLQDATNATVQQQAA